MDSEGTASVSTSAASLSATGSVVFTGTSALASPPPELAAAGESLLTNLTSVMPFDQGSVNLDSIQPFELQANAIVVDSIQPFFLEGPVELSSTQPFVQGETIGVSSTQPFSILSPLDAKVGAGFASPKFGWWTD